MISSLPVAALAAAGLVAASTAAQAQSTLRIHGVLDASAGSFQDAGAARDRRIDSGTLTTSHLGVSGVEDLSGGLKVTFSIEHFLRLDQGEAGRYSGDAFWARNAYVGLHGAFGKSLLGRNTTPLFAATTQFNAFGESFGVSPAVRQIFAPAMLPYFGDRGWSNSLAYTSNNGDGLTLQLMANLTEAAPGATGRNAAAGALYVSGPLAATAGLQLVRNGDGISTGTLSAPAGFARQNTWQLGASYDLVVVKLFGLYTEVKTTAAANSKTKIWGWGTTMPLPGGKLLAQYGSATARAAGGETVHRTLSLGYDHDLSKTTDLYAVWMTDKITGLSRGNTLAGGMRLRF